VPDLPAVAQPDVPRPPDFDLALVDREQGVTFGASRGEATGTGD
jgi:hypothetical protein